MIRAAHIGKVEIARMTTFIRLNQSHKDYVPRIESPDIESLSIGSLRSGIVWSGNLTFDTNGDVTAGSFDEPYATIGELHVGCWWSNGDIWMEGCPTTTIDTDLRGRLHVSTLAFGEAVRVGRELSTAYGDSLSYCPCDVDDSADSCVSETGYNTSLSEPSPRRGRLRGTESLASNTVYGEIMTRHNDGLEGQVILNRNDVLPITGFTGWEGLVTLGEFDDEEDRIVLSPYSSSPDESPYYERISAEVGGGAVGLAPFHLYETDCSPPHDPDEVDPGILESVMNGCDTTQGSVLVRFYGPVKRSIPASAWSNHIHIRCRPLSTPAVTFEPCYWIDATSAFDISGPGDVGWTGDNRSIRISRKSPYHVAPGVYLVHPVSLDAVRCDDVTESPDAVWPTVCDFDDEERVGYVFRVGPDCDCDGIDDAEDTDVSSCGTDCTIADFNDSGTVTVQDIFDFLSAYFAGCTGYSMPACIASADVNHSGTVTVQDIFDFLAAFFSVGIDGNCS